MDCKNSGSVVMAVYASVYAFYGYDILNNGIEDLAEPRRFPFFRFLGGRVSR